MPQDLPQSDFFESATAKDNSENTVDVSPESDNSQSGSVAGIQFQPTVFIGVGGTGLQCLRRAKFLIKQRLNGQMLPTIRFVYIDADKAAPGDKAGLAPVEQAEWCPIGGAQMNALLDNKRQHAWILDQIPGKLQPGYLEPPAKGAGCGQIRTVGRVALLTSMNQVEAKLKQALNQVQSLDSDSLTRLQVAPRGAALAQEPAIYIVGSLAGGTGSGAYLDVALLARSLSNHTASLTGIFVLPDAFSEASVGDKDVHRILRANTYAALIELQALQDMDDQFRIDVQTSSTGSRIQFGNGQKLFDLCYLIDRKNEKGQSLKNQNDVFELVSQIIVNNVASTVGAHARSLEVNLPTLKNLALCPESRKRRNFSTFSATKLSFPVEAITKHCTWSTVRECLFKEVLKNELFTGVNEEVQAFLSGHDLDEMNSTDQVISRLLGDPKTKKEITPASVGVGLGFGKDLKNSDFVTQIRQKFNSFEADLPNHRRIVDDNIIYYLGHPSSPDTPLDSWLDDALEIWLGKFGVRGALSISRALEAQCTELRKQMIIENTIWDNQERKAKASSFNNLINDLSGMGRVKAIFSRKDDQIRAALVQTFVAYIKGEQRVPARNAATKVFDRLLAILAERKKAMELFITACTQIDAKLAESIESQRIARRSGKQGIVTDQDVTNPEYPETYFQENRVEPLSILAELLRDIASSRPWIGLLSANVATLQDGLLKRTMSVYWNKIKDIDLVSFVAGQGDGQAILSAKLGQLFSMCEPFWYSQQPSSDLTYNDILTLTCMPVPVKGGDVVFPPLVQKWSETFASQTKGGVAKQPTLIASTLPYQVELVRYTHGARAYYLRDASSWKQCFEETVKGGHYPMFLHKDFQQAPDLFPDENAEARTYFALALGMGLIAKRGQFYYPNVDDVNGRFEVNLNSEWTTIFGPQDSRNTPDNGQVGDIYFRLNLKTPPKQSPKWNGRQVACDQFCSGTFKEFFEIVKKVVAMYWENRGTSTFRAELKTYELFLLGASDSPGGNAPQLKQEYRIVSEFIVNMD